MFEVDTDKCTYLYIFNYLLGNLITKYSNKDGDFNGF